MAHGPGGVSPSTPSPSKRREHERADLIHGTCHVRMPPAVPARTLLCGGADVLALFSPSWETTWGKAQNGRGARGPRNFGGTGRLGWHVCCRKNVPHGRCQGRGRRGWRGPSSPAKWAPDCLACTRRAERHAWLSRHTTVDPTLPLGVSPPSLTCFRDSHALSRFQPAPPPWAPAQLRSTLQFPRPCLSLCPRVDTDMFPLY